MGGGGLHPNIHFFYFRNKETKVHFPGDSSPNSEEQKEEEEEVEVEEEGGRESRLYSSRAPGRIKGGGGRHGAAQTFELVE